MFIVARCKGQSGVDFSTRARDNMAVGTEPYVIATVGKDKIAHTHSYPIGAEALSRALADVPQLHQICLFPPDAFSASVVLGRSGATTQEK